MVLWTYGILHTGVINRNIIIRAGGDGVVPHVRLETRKPGQIRGVDLYNAVSELEL